MSQYLLPRLKTRDANIKPPQNPGHWLYQNVDEINNIAEAIDCDNLEIDITSIPDIWARALLFEMAFFDPNHSLHNRVVGEWRGLLALLAFYQRKNLKLEIIPFQDVTHSDLYRVVQSLVPAVSYDPHTNWRNGVSLILLGLNRNPIGITSPSTLVCTAASCNYMLPGVRWAKGEYLRDPVKALNASEKSEMVSWLVRVEASFLRAGIVPDPKANLLIREIDAFSQDLAGPSNLVQALPNFQPDPTPWHFTGYLDCLSQAIPRGSQKNSDVSLVDSDDCNPASRIFVVDRNVPKSWKKLDRQETIHVVDDLYFPDVVPYEGLTTPTDVIGGKTCDGCLLWQDKDFFLPKLFVIENKNALPGALPLKHPAFLTGLDGKEVTPLLPLNPEILHHLNPAKLAAAIEFSQGVDKSITVSLNLELGNNGQRRSYAPSRTYQFKEKPEENQIEIVTDIPILELWPNFLDDQWKDYYFYYSSGDSRWTFSVQPFPPANPDFVYRMTDSEGHISTEIQKMSSFPKAFLCLRGEAQAGIILPKVQKSKRGDLSQPKVMKIGIDLGTTSTNMYGLVTGVPEKIDLEAGLLSLTEHKRREYYLFQDFLSPSGIKAPFPTLYQQFRVTKYQVQEPETAPLLTDGHIYYLETQNYRDIVTEKIKGLMTDLKWSREMNAPVEAFLKQLCLQCAAYAIQNGATEVRWRFSIPTAFSRTERSTFRKIWDDIIGEISRSTGLLFRKVDCRSESVASGHYFSMLQAEGIEHLNSVRGAVCVDIGGGTTDISIWQRRPQKDYELRLQTSIRIAGRDIFLDLIGEDIEFFYDIACRKDLLENLKKNRRDIPLFLAQLDSIISFEGKYWFNNIIRQAMQTKTKNFLQNIEIGLSGVFYYIGLLLKILREAGDFGEDIPHFYVGGKGAQLLQWAARGDFDQNSSFCRGLKTVLQNASGGVFKDTPFGIFVSPEGELKSEVAHGLTIDDFVLRENGELNSQERIIAGENFRHKEQAKGFAESLDMSMFLDGICVEKLDHLRAFVEGYNQTASRLRYPTIDFGPDIEKNIAHEINDCLDNMRILNKESLRIEPLFVLGLKVLLKGLHRKWGGVKAGGE